MTAISIQISARPPGSDQSAAAWPDEAWKAKVVAAGDWRPVPFRQFIVKLHSRCNLSCDYCYIYEMADQTWRTLPGGMARETLRQAARRIGEYAERHGLAEVQVIYHGGEPLLVGPDYLDFASEEIRAAMPATTTAVLSVQTNGVLVDERMLQTLVRHEVGLGVSLDGGREANDRHRRYANGNGSFDQVARALSLVNQPEYRHLFSILLCTIDVTRDPVETFESLLEFDPPAVDFLLPLGNWSSPPPLLPAPPGETPYAEWLIAIFDRWYSAPSQETDVRLLQAIIDEVLGNPSGFEKVGLTPSAAIEVETDGSMHQVCSLKSAYDGATCTNLNVFAHTFDQAMEHPAVVARQVGRAALSDTCQDCDIRDMCGGGYYAHRYRADTGFRNPSVYCPDLFRLFGHVGRRVYADLARLTSGGAR
ncbi:hypothetical protein GCM10022225_42310 [Plantactinospora mayteni]|uniref:Radical SAM core domain-containing protein n=1 Tax=Plantactinospora mayteni TaxID=566021 RepID=A0ABQ4EUC6_9ACTN|nr:FxsB family cyclophane-forming radical SAM/SPASM peptide maturase [Plantactinospora mayteni]GIG98255.1 hypothetical protein Pma05_48280 [Plantactinospora mayteni]